MSGRAARPQVPRSGAESVPPDEKDVDTCGADGNGSADEHKSGEDSSASNSSSSSGDESDPEESDVRKSDEEQEKEESPPRCNGSGANSLLHCEHCRNEDVQKEQVMPRRLSGEQYLLRLEGEGAFQCSATGLIFEATAAASVRYSVLSWSKYAALVGDGWLAGGPLFDVHCTPAAALAAIGFPHALCLGGGDAQPAFKVLHVTAGGSAALEAPAECSASHVRWLVSSLSPVGPLLRAEEPLLYHGAVVLYKVLDGHPSLSFRVYVATNNDSFIKDIARAVKHSSKKFVKIDKPPVCQKLLQKGKRYRLLCEPEAEVTPEEIEFVDGSLLKLKSYIEVYLEKPDDLTLSLVELESDAVVWKAKLRESDWIHHDQNRNEQKRSAVGTKRRKSTHSFSEDEEYCWKKRKGSDTADGVKAKSLLTDQQLMAIAKRFGREWKEIAIECLQLEMKDIHQIQAKEEEVNIHKFLMLSKWRDREQSNGTAQSLYDSLKDKVSYDVVEVLEGFLAQ
ncbi:uncharacterized protein LOC112981348 isoform X1 [Dromaius novaehollandiae]|uniref:uncharacterized protein LOC112981348 isoform X1 n=1 Tax=Dromaius novaehollandiae TaxID=8790 RepID=UPI00311EB03A